MKTVYDFTVKDRKGNDVSLKEYANEVLLIVNTATKCGFTPQYAQLEALHEKYGPRGLTVVGFPCNQFRQQEPGSNADIGAFCEKNFGVTFPLFAKIDVNGPQTHPLFAQLKQAAPGILGTQSIKWNFTKFLVRKDGSVFRRYATASKPASLAADIRQLLQE